MKRLTVGSCRDFLGRLRTVIAGLVCLAGVLGAGAATHKITVSGGFLNDGEATTLSGLEAGADISAYIDQSKCLDKNEMFVNDFAHWTYTPATADLGEGFDPFSQKVTVTMPDADVKLTANFVNGFAAYIYCASGYMDGDEDGLPEGEFYWSVDNGKTLIPFGHEFANGGYPVKPGTVTVKFYDKTGNWRAGDWTYMVEKRGTFKEGSTTYYLDPAFFYLSSVKFVPVKKSTAVKLDANGGSGSKETFQVEGYPFGALPIATRKGYVFAGWWTQKDGGEHVIEDKIFQAADFAGQKTPTIYAHWLQLRKLTLKETKGAWQYASWYVEPEHFDGDDQLFSEISASYYRLHPELEDEGYLQGYSDEKGVMEVLPGAQVYVEASDEIVDKNGNELTFQKWTVSPSKADMGANFFASNPSTDLTMPDADVSLQPTYIDANACGWVHGYAYANSIYLGWDEEAEMDVTLYPPAGAFEWSPDAGKTWYKASSGNYDAPDALLKEGRYTITWRSTDPHWVTTDKTTVTVGGCNLCGIGDASVNASFTYVPEITIDVMTIGGSICEPSCAPGGTATMNPKDGLVPPKKTITLTAKAAKNYVFQGWALAKYWEYGYSFKNTDATWKLENYTNGSMCSDGESYLNNYIDPTDKKVHVVAVFKALSAYSEDDISFDGFEGSDTYNGADDDAVTIKAVVGCALDDDLALVCGPLAGPLAYKLNGKLPDGLKFDAKKGVLSGAPKKPGETTVTITATDPAKNAKNLTVTFIVNSLPDWLVGEFRGIMSEEKYVPGYWDWDDETQEEHWVAGYYLPSQQNGILELSVKSDGKVSAKVLTQLGTRSVSGTLTWRDPETDEDYDDDDEFAEFRFWHEDAKDESYCHVRFYSDGTIDGYVDSYDKTEDDWFGGDMVGMRQDTALLAKSNFLDKYYTFAFCATTKDDEDESGMQSGYGYLTLKTDKKGVAKVTGQLPDGEKVSMSALVLPESYSEGGVPVADDISARIYVFASPSSYKKQDWFAMTLMLDPSGSVWSMDGAAWTAASPKVSGGSLCAPESDSSRNAVVYGDGALYSEAKSLENHYWKAYCAYSENVQLEYTCKATYKEGGKTYTDTWPDYAYARGFPSEFLDNDCFFCVAVQGDAKGAISLKEKSPAPWARAYKEGGQSFMEWEYSEDKNGKMITDPSQLSISFAKATGIFTGKAKVYFDYEVFNYKNGEEIWTKQHKDATLPYSGVMIYDGDGDYYGYGSAVHTFKYTDYDENDKKTTVTKKVTLPVSLQKLADPMPYVGQGI